MLLTKIHSNDCEVCRELGDKATTIADKYDFQYEQVDVEVLARTPGPLRDYALKVHVAQDTGMIDLPIYVLTTGDGDIQGSSVVKTLDEVENLISAWTQWAHSQKP